MVSEYLKETRSLGELDVLFEQDRVTAAKIAATSFKHEISVAITNISEINQIANARIMADCQVASAKMMTSAEITVANLISQAEMAVLEIRKRLVDDSSDSEIPHDMIVETSRIATESITDTARSSVQNIQDNARDAINQLKSHAAKAIAEIQGFSENIATRIAGDAEAVRAKLPEDVEALAELEAQKILETAAGVTADLHESLKATISQLNALTDEATKTIMGSVSVSEKRITESRDKALLRLREVVEVLFPA